MNPVLLQDKHTHSFFRQRDEQSPIQPDESSRQPPYRRLFPNRYGQLIPPVGSLARASTGHSMSCNDLDYQDSRIEPSAGPQHSENRAKPKSFLPALLHEHGDIQGERMSTPRFVDYSSTLRTPSTSTDPMSPIEHPAGLQPCFEENAHTRVESNDNVPKTEIRRCLSSKELRTVAPLSGSPYAFMLYQKGQISAHMTQRLRQTIANPALRSASDDSSGSSIGGPLNNKARNQRRAEHNLAITNELCEIVTDLFVAESKLINPSNYGVDSTQKRDQVLRSVERFVGSLPPRYALSAETPSEVLLHMRLAAAVRSDPTRAVVHIMKIENSSHWTRTSKDGRSIKLVTIACSDSNGLLEYVTKTLASGGSRVLDADVMLSVDNIALDRFVVEMHGRLRLDKLSQCIESFLQQNDRKTDVSTMHQPPEDRSDSVSSGGSRCSSDIASAVYFRSSTNRNRREIQDEITTGVPLSEVVASGNTDAGLISLPSDGNRSVPMSWHPSIPRFLESPLSSDGPDTAGTCDVEAFRNEANHLKGNEFLSMPASKVKSDHGNMSHRRPLVSRKENPDFHAASPNEANDDRSVNEPSSPPQIRSGSNFDLEVSEVDDWSPQSTTRRPLVKRSGNSDFDAIEQSETDVVVSEQSKSFSRTLDVTVPLIPFDELVLIETLGLGRVSTIYRAAWRTKLSDHYPDIVNGQMLALKVAIMQASTSDTSHVDELRREADIAARLRHPNICDLKGIASDFDCFCLAYEFCEGGSLLSLLSDSTRYYEYLPIALDIANGMAYLHSRDVIHRDLKPSNVLLTRDHRAKISDFGMSVANAGQELTAETGTYRYMAPEVIRHESYSSNADVYSFGVCLWQLITSEVPFATMSPVQAAYSVAEGRRPAIPESTPQRLKEIISACWDQDAGRRPSFTYIAMALADYAKTAFSPANVGANTLHIANEMLANVDGNSTVNVDFTTPVILGAYMDQVDISTGGSDIGLEI